MAKAPQERPVKVSSRSLTEEEKAAAEAAATAAVADLRRQQARQECDHCGAEVLRVPVSYHPAEEGPTVVELDADPVDTPELRSLWLVRDVTAGQEARPVVGFNADSEEHSIHELHDCQAEEPAEVEDPPE